MRHLVLPSSFLESAGSVLPEPTENTLFVEPPPTKYSPFIDTLRTSFVTGSHRQTEPVASATIPFVE